MQRLGWRQPNPVMQLRAFVMRLEGHALTPHMDANDLRLAIESRAEELRELLPYLEGEKQWVDINSLRGRDKCPSCHNGALQYDEYHHLICSECKVDFSS